MVSELAALDRRDQPTLQLEVFQFVGETRNYWVRLWGLNLSAVIVGRRVVFVSVWSGF